MQQRQREFSRWTQLPFWKHRFSWRFTNAMSCFLWTYAYFVLVLLSGCEIKFVFAESKTISGTWRSPTRTPPKSDVSKNAFSFEKELCPENLVFVFFLGRRWEHSFLPPNTTPPFFAFHTNEKRFSLPRRCFHKNCCIEKFFSLTFPLLMVKVDRHPGCAADK